MAGRHGNKGVISQVVPVEDMPFLTDGTPIDLILNPLGVPGRMNIGQILETHLGWASSRLGIRAITPVFDGADEAQVEAELARAWLIDRAWDEITERAWAWLKAQDYPLSTLRDDDEARLLYIVAWLAERDYDVDRLTLERVYARRAVLREWLRERGHEPDDILSFEDDTRTLAERVVADRRARIACLRLWLQDRGREVASLDDEAVEALAMQVSVETSDPLPILGKMTLYNGKTGGPYDRPVTVGVIYMMKLAHLVEDKVHARSYGAAHALQEMLTIKSDDVQGRVKTYEAIVKGESVQEAGVPASFKVLVKELQSLGLAVEAITQDGEVLRFGRDEEKNKVAKSTCVDCPSRRRATLQMCDVSVV
jgi:DNA-directed RNA polymerase subunit beta